MAELADLPACPRMILRGGPAAIAQAAAALGFALPHQACRATSLNGRHALWLGPDEWLLLSPPDGLGAALDGHAHSLVDVSHRQVALRLAGADAADQLNAGCPLDLHVDAFPVGMCTRTILGKSEIVLWRTEPDAFRLEVARSFAPYVRAFLEEAAIA